MQKDNATVWVVDDDESVCCGLAELFRSVGLRCCTFNSASAFLNAYDGSRPGCVVLDMRLPGMSGMRAQERMQELGIELPIVFVSDHADVRTAVSAMERGAVTVIDKPLSFSLLLDYVQRCIEADREAYERQRRRSEIKQRLDSLSPRQRQVLDLIVAGKANKEIARKLGISLKTVELHRSCVMQKMKAGSLAELVRLVLMAQQKH